MTRIPDQVPADWTADERLAGDFLAGWLEEINGRTVHRYFKPGGAEERAGLDALLRVLRDPRVPDSYDDRDRPPFLYAIRCRIAGLLDPAQDTEHRKFAFKNGALTIKNRKRGRQRDHDREAEILHFIEQKRAEGFSVDNAIEAALDHIPTSETTIKRVRRRYKALSKQTKRQGSNKRSK